MRIVIINKHPHDFLGGSEIQCDFIATYLARFGHQVTYLAVKGKPSGYDVPYQVISLSGLDPVRLYRLFRSLRPDVVYWRYNKFGLLPAALVAKLARSTFVFSMSSPTDTRVFQEMGAPSLRDCAGALFRRTPRPAAFLKTWARFLFTSVRSAVNYPAIPLCVDAVVSLNVDFLAGAPVGRKIAIHNSFPSEASEYHWPKPYVVWVANLKAVKHPEIYHQLALALEGSGVDFLMVGDIQEKTYDYLLSAGGQPAGFHYLGPKSPLEVNGIVRNALFLVHTGDPEGFGNIFIQAWLQGKPTIALSFDPEGIIEREGLGYLSRSFPVLVDHTRLLIEDSRARAIMGARASQYASEHFDSENNVRRLELFLQQLIHYNALPKE